MAKLGIMIEGQEGLSWERWRRICTDAERLGFDSLRRSDHLFSLQGISDRQNIECWTSLALAARWTERIQFGPMVSPMTFRLPAILARMAAAVDQLSGGRLLLGVGAGWNQAEHEAFGVPFPDLKTRFDNLEAGIARIRQTWELSAPHPVRDGAVPLLIGGGGERRTLGLAAREGVEWNLTGPNLDAFRTKSAILDERCRAIGRDPAEVRRSVMGSYLVGRDRAELEDRVRALEEVMPRFAGKEPGEVIESLRGRWFIGTPAEVVEAMRGYIEAGVDLFMLQHFLMDDSDQLELLAAEVMPAIA